MLKRDESEELERVKDFYRKKTGVEIPQPDIKGNYSLSVIIYNRSPWEGPYGSKKRVHWNWEENEFFIRYRRFINRRREKMWTYPIETQEWDQNRSLQPYYSWLLRSFRKINTWI